MEDANKVVTDHNACSAIGEEILKNGGNAVDAAVAATICMAVDEPHVTGLVAICLITNVFIEWRIVADMPSTFTPLITLKFWQDLVKL